jgi:oligo-1,6-glucosidase
MMAGLVMTLRGTPYVFEGQEIGMTNGDFENLDEVADIESHNVYKIAKSLGIPKGARWKMIKRSSRDNARTPMQWNADDGAGFTSGTPWLKINANRRDINVESELSKERGVLSFWKKMIELRKTLPALLDGKFIPVFEGRSVYAFERVCDGERLLAIFNMCGKCVKIPKKIDSSGDVVISTHESGNIMSPFEFRLIRKGQS